jgi:hypothetical protein
MSDGHLHGEEARFRLHLGKELKMEVSEYWIPIVMFVGMAVVLSLWVWFRIRTAIEKGQELSPELIENLVNPPISPKRDLRRGVIGVVLAIGFALFGVILGEEDAIRPLLGVAMFPFSIGVAFLLMHRYGRSD